MEQIPTIQSIKKCKKDSPTLSLQEKDDEVGVRGNSCSTFLRSSGLLAQGEWCNPKSDQRNAVITFRDPKTSQIKGRVFWILCFFTSGFLLLVRGLNPR